jgi:hypothetical protein
MGVYVLSQPPAPVIFTLQPLYPLQNNDKTNLRLCKESNTAFQFSQPVP